MLGLLPQQSRQWVRKEGGNYIDLITFKQEELLDNLDWGEWFKRTQHPHLSILDTLATNNAPLFLFKEEGKAHVLYNVEGIYFKS